jgi:HAD superfamily hydrolase (TIGR01450 family)
MSVLIDEYPGACFDLDGVIYRVPQPVPGAPETVAELRRMGVPVLFVTNNAAPSPVSVVGTLAEMGIPATLPDVLSSSQAIAELMATELPAGAKVLVAGTENLAAEIANVGLQPVESHLDQPDAVVQGYHPELPWWLMDEACLALGAGAVWYASNLDPTRPVAAGIVPGAGAQVAAMRECFPDRAPIVAGKPYPPLLRAAVRRLGVANPIFVGDRLDTDIEGAHNAGLDSLFVLTGAHGKSELAQAPTNRRPTHIGFDISALLKPERIVEIAGHVSSCAGQQLHYTGDAIVLETEPTDLEAQLDALWAGAQLGWRFPDAEPRYLEQLDLLP